MKNLLWIGDGPDVPSGFGRATREIVASLDYRLGGPFNVTVLGINYLGDPKTVPYEVYSTLPGGDAFGIGRLIWMCDKVQPDVIVIQQDGWNVPFYTNQLARFPEYAKIPVVAAVAVDGLNFNGEWLKGVSLAIFWSQFALREARKGGYTGAAKVIPLGVDPDIYKPGDKMAARKARGIEVLCDKFIVGNVNRNQPRKRWDLQLRYFAEWIHSRNITDAFLFLHTAPTGDQGIDVVRLARYYSILDHIALIEPQVHYGISEQEMCDTYNCFDVYSSTTQGEGFGLPAAEAMACGVPCVLPDWSAYGDWTKDAALLVPCSSTAVGSPWVNVLGGCVDETGFIAALDSLYRDHALRTDVACRGKARVNEDRFRWENIGQAWAEALEKVLKVERKAVLNAPKSVN